MTAAIALAVVLVIAVAGASMALESQRSGQTPVRRPTRPARPADRERSRRPFRGKDRSPSTDAGSGDAPPPPVPMPDPEPRRPDLLRTGTEGWAKVISVVDERTIGLVTRSRLVLRLEPEGGDPLEVTVRHAFPTPDARAEIRVGGVVPVRYDPDEPRRVVIDLPQG